MIRNCLLQDAQAICNIYNYYIENTVITFEEGTIVPSIMEERIKALQSKGHPWIVYEENSQVIGYAYAGEFKSRCAYRFTLETSLYLSHKHLEKGIGSKLYSALIDKCRLMGIHSLVGIIAVPNEPSISIHEKFSFKKAGFLSEVGYKFNKWINVEYWQLML